MAGSGQLSQAMDNVIRELFENTAAKTGQEFFDALVRNMSRIFGTRGAWVTEYFARESHLETKAFWFGNRFVNDYVFKVKGTPCETVINDRQFVLIPDNLLDLYPEDNHGVSEGAVSYMGVPIFDDDKATVLGHLAVMDMKPFHPNPDMIRVFQLFAERASAELRRIKETQHLHEQIQHILKDAYRPEPGSVEASQDQYGEEELIFMFLDISSSTSIAEKIGHEKFFEMIRDFFSDITFPIISNLGKIHKYVGDEVIVYWKLNEGIREANCLKAFFDIEKAMEAHRDAYIMKFGIFPRFKAGMHCGKVSTGTIGTVVKEDVFSGDVMNTTSRITSLCNDLGAKLLVSEELASMLKSTNSYLYKKIEHIRLKGKQQETTLYEILPA